MKITEVEVKHTVDTKSAKPVEQNNRNRIQWREFPRWDIKELILDDKEDKQKYLNKIKDNLICESTYSNKHHIMYWKHYNTLEEYNKDQENG